MFIKYPSNVSYCNPHGYMPLFNIYNDCLQEFRSPEKDMFPPNEMIYCFACSKCCRFRNVRKHANSRGHLDQF